MAVERVQKLTVVGRTLLTGLLGGAAAGAISAPLSLAVIIIVESISGPYVDPSLGTTSGGDTASTDSTESTADTVTLVVVQAIGALLNLAVVGGLAGMVAGLVVALPVAAVMALAAPWLAGQPAPARLVCASACVTATVAFEAGVVAVSGGWEDSFFGEPLFLSPPLVIAAFVGYRYGPRLVAAPAPE
ncbi:hypothetical protein GCM10010156_15950 [Planobispora rosea]|uniref:Uncharacterized protein n=1 Tax=Planobispora rosea TaxID=35762 RepID=A0A8J3WEB9_PLARO|nr:hypothetical protein [Planobispora rosea]GGS58152.1 hypothetical protein GCM10010156_15950 [Planobispora rosea]GIH84796.1 hypothetical protein Pro02_32040 [Planobispora rosea]